MTFKDTGINPGHEFNQVSNEKSRLKHLIFHQQKKVLGFLGAICFQSFRLWAVHMTGRLRWKNDPQPVLEILLPRKLTWRLLENTPILMGETSAHSWSEFSSQSCSVSGIFLVEIDRVFHRNNFTSEYRRRYDLIFTWAMNKTPRVV